VIKFETKCLLSKPLYLKRGNAQLCYPLIISNTNTYYRMSLVADINISQGSVATGLRYGGIFKYDYVTSLLLSLIVKEL